MPTLHVRDVMHSPTYNITPRTTLPEIERRLREHGVHHLPVIDRAGVVGIVTRGDVRHAGPSDVPLLRQYERSALLEQISAANIMSRPVISVAASAPVTEAARLMLIHKISGVPVLRGGQFVGMITSNDILSAVAGEPVTNE